MTGTILETIVATKRDEVARAQRATPLDEVRDAALRAGPPRDFYGAVAAPSASVRLIAEVKRASPSAGLIRSDFDPVAIARTYAACGAAALSVLTDRKYFQGDGSHIAAARIAVTLPVLRKDFIIDEYQVYESRAIGADAILLIAAILDAARIERFASLAARLGMTSLIEVHTGDELRSVRELLGPGRRALVGVNNRDLHTQRIDLKTTRRLARELPTGTPLVAESGLASREDVQAMRAAGAAAVLIGEAFMRADNIASKVRELMG